MAWSMRKGYYEMTKIIKTKQGDDILVDDEDYVLLSRISWRTVIYNKPTSSHKRPFASITPQSLIINNVIQTGMVIDHIDRNPFNNCKSNLRIVDYSTNAQNRSRNPKAKSKYKGVHKTSPGRYVAHIHFRNKCIHLGVFSSEIDAAKAYNNNAKRLFGDNAFINIIDDDLQDLLPGFD